MVTPGTFTKLNVPEKPACSLVDITYPGPTAYLLRKKHLALPKVWAPRLRPVPLEKWLEASLLDARLILKTRSRLLKQPSATARCGR